MEEYSADEWQPQEFLPCIKDLKNLVRISYFSRLDSCYDARVAIYAPYFLANVPDAALAYAAWDLPRKKTQSRPEELQEDLLERFTSHLRQMPFFGCAWFDGKALALAWLREITKECAEVHFLICQRKPEAILKAGQDFMEQALKRYANLLAIVPRPFFGAKALALALGFQFLSRVPKICPILSKGIISDGLLFSYSKAKGF